MSTLFDLTTIKVLHIEPTTVCNAACPQCDRENPLLYNKCNQCELTLADIQRLVPVSVIENLDKMFMCGNFGEPAAAKECLEIYKYFKQINPDITLGLNTNGGVRNTKWWTQLGKIFNGVYDYVVFSIDGLEDTNHIYRINVSWKKLLENAQAYINAGGTAHWDMLVFEHNQHQVEDAKNLADQMKFSWFRSKVSKRFATTPIRFINPPEGYTRPNVQNPTQVDCFALNENSMFLAANGEFLPCCFIGPYIFARDKHLANALDTKNFQGVIDSWTSDPLPICLETCGTNNCSKGSFENQWKTEIQLR
jgi:hypothetical protein